MFLKNKIEKISRFSLIILGFACFYSLLSSILFAYTGLHWQSKITGAERLILNIVSIFFIVLACFFSFRYLSFFSYYISNFIDRIRFRIILFIALAVRLIWVTTSGVQQTSDFLAYNQVAMQILDGDDIVSHLFASRAVGPSIFFSFIYTLLGPHEMFAQIVIALMSSIQLVLVYKILTRVTNKKSAKIATLIMLFFPEHVILNNLLGSDVLFSTFSIVGLFFITTAIYGHKFHYLSVFVARFARGVSHWMRTIAPLFLISTMIFLIVNQSGKFKQTLLAQFILILGFILPISPIIYHNYGRSGNLDIKSVNWGKVF